MDGISAGLIQYLPPGEGHPRRQVVWESVGFPGTWTEGGMLIMAVEIEPLVETTGVRLTGGGPMVTVRELDPGEELATSGPLVHREYFFVGDRRWLFEVAPRPDSAFAVDWTIPIGTGVLGARGGGDGMVGDTIETASASYHAGTDDCLSAE